MTPQERARRAWDIFDDVCDLDSAERSRVLGDACGNDAALRHEVESLLEFDGTTPDVDVLEAGRGADALARCLANDGSSENAIEATAFPEHIGDYRIIRRIGEGGMGTVYEAEQDAPKRRVAVKVIRAGMASRHTLKRFQHEFNVLGQLQHPGIAHVYEAGVDATSAGRLPFFVMELIDGLPLDRFANTQNLGILSRLELLARVCDAVQHAHQKGIIHRDLKPANVLVVQDEPSSGRTGSTVDALGQPKVLDFGVARLIDEDLHTVSLHTEGSELLGTLAYMSPEQVRGHPSETDTRSDVYALGVILFQVLAGRLPYNIRHVSVVEAARVICEENPQRLSSIDGRLRGDIELIVNKALSKEPERRYGSAAELAADLRRHIADEPIEARPATTFYHVRKFARRHKGLVTGGILAVLALIIGSIGMAILSAVAFEARKVAEHNASESERAAYRAHIVGAAATLRERDMAAAEKLLMESPVSLRGWEWRLLYSRLDECGASLAVQQPIADIAFSKDGDQLITLLNQPRCIRAWTVSELQPVQHEADEVVHGRLPRRTFQSGFHLRSPQKQTELAAVVEDWPPGVRIAVIPHDARAVSALAAAKDIVADLPPRTWLAFSASGNRMAAYDLRAGGAVWNLRPRQRMMDIPPNPERLNSVVFDDLGSRLLIAAADRSLSMWNVDTGVCEWLQKEAHNDALRDARFSPDGTWVATGGEDRLVRLWEAGTGRLLRTFAGHRSPVRQVRFAPDGGRLASAEPGELRVWDTQADAKAWTLRGHREPVKSLDLSPNRGILASAGDDLRLWDARTGRPLGVMVQSTGEIDRVPLVSFSPDGNRLVFTTVATDPAPPRSTVHVCDLRTGSMTDHDLERRFGRLDDIGHSPDGRLLVVSDGNPALVTILDADTLDIRAEFDASRFAFDTAGGWLALGGKRRVRLVDVRSFEVIREWSVRMSSCITFSPDGRFLVGGAKLQVIDLQTGEIRKLLANERAKVVSVAFAPDGSRLFSGGADRTIRLWDPDTGENLLRISEHRDQVNDLVFSADGNCMWSCSGDRTVRIWDTRPLGTLLNDRREYDSVSARLELRLADLFDQLGAWPAVAAHIEDVDHLSDREREIAGQLILRRLLTSGGAALDVDNEIRP